MTGPSLRIGLVDDHAVVRAGYRRLLELEGLSVVVEAGDADSAYAALGREDELPVDVLVVDIELPSRSGLDFTRHVRHRWPQARVLIFTMHDDPATIAQCLRAGATGFVTKSSDPDVLVDAVRRVARGETALSPDLAGRVDEAQALPQAGLNTREFDVLTCLARGDSVDQIAARLHVSPKTIANYQSAIKKKLGIGSPIELLRYARQVMPPD